MADNIPLNEGVGGKTLRSKDIGGVQTQFNALELVHGSTSQGTVSYSNPMPITGVGAMVDAFGRFRTSNAVNLLNPQFTYNLRPLTYEQVTSGTGASIAHDATNRCALMTFSSTPTGGKAYMQSYEFFPYQAGNSHLIFVTFNMIEGVANVLKFAGYGEYQTNGVFFELNGTARQFTLYSNTDLGDTTVPQASWNLDPLDGTGPSGYTFDETKVQIVVIDLQALYVGRVRIGFDIDGDVIYCHEFLHANNIDVPYIQIASLPVLCGMTCSGTVSTTMRFVCAGVKSEGGEDDQAGSPMCIEATGTAGNSTRAHILSVRPKTTFGGFTNRSKFVLESVDVLVTGNQNVLVELAIGQAISGATTFSDVNATYSSMEYNSAGTISGSPAIVAGAQYVVSSNTAKGAVSRSFATRYPITLDAAGAARSLGTLSVLGTGLGGTSAMRVVLGWREIR